MRHCPSCNKFRTRAMFLRRADGAFHRDCVACEGVRATRKLANSKHLHATREFPGVDIDRVHKLRVKKGST